MKDEGAVRIGELSRRSGVSPELLRAWERRYGLLRPDRSPGGLRLYSAEDVERVRLMRRHLDAGLSAAEAAALAAREPVEAASASLQPAVLRRELTEALDAFDEPRAQDVFDRALTIATADTLLRELVLPYLHELGERWERRDVSVAQEHFASALLRGRLLGLARGWGLGVGPLAVLACLPGERHDLGLIAFGLALRARGWRIGFLGSDTPLDTVADASSAVDADLIVLSATTSELLESVREELVELAGRFTVALGGALAKAPGLEESGVELLEGDVIAAATRVAEHSGRTSRASARDLGAAGLSPPTGG